MTSKNENISVELLRIKNATFALVFEDQSKNKEAITEVIQKLPNCCFDKNRLWKIQSLYNEIRDSRVVSLEDVYAVFGIDCEANTPLFCNHKRQCVKEFRQLITNIIDETITQIKRNINKVNIPKLAYSIFYRAQEFTESKPKFISNMWFLGNATQANTNMKEAFESFTMASLSLKQNPQFCVERLEQLLEAIKFSIKDSFRIHYLDNILDQIYHWYFIESETSYDFLIFFPDAFDEIRDFLLDVIDKNPFVYLLRDNNGYYEKLTDDECCLDADNILFIPEDSFEGVKCFRELYRMYDSYYSTHKALKQYGMFNCKCYDITHLVSSTFSKSPYKRKLSLAAIENLISDENYLFEYKNTIHDKIDFTRHIVKPRLNKDHLEQQIKEA